MPIGQLTPGPNLIFVRFRNNSTAFFLGTGVTTVVPEAEKQKLPVMNDLAGRSEPFQLVQDGEHHYVQVTLNRFDYSLLQSIRALESGTPAGNTLGNPNVGSETAIARGTLVLGITDFQLIIVYQYAGTPSAGQFAGGVSDLPVGRGYYSANLRSYKESTEGTRVLEVALLLECLNLFVGAQQQQGSQNPQFSFPGILGVGINIATNINALGLGASGFGGFRLFVEPTNIADFGTLAPIV